VVVLVGRDVQELGAMGAVLQKLEPEAQDGDSS
jgi:hypothetical protein